jgi:MFS family permease
MGSASAFWSLLTFRLLLGLGAAFSSPASYSMIADLFPPEQRPTANGDMLA